MTALDQHLARAFAIRTSCVRFHLSNRSIEWIAQIFLKGDSSKMKMIKLHIVIWWCNWQCDRAFYVQSLLMWLFLSQKGTFFFFFFLYSQLGNQDHTTWPLKTFFSEALLRTSRLWQCWHGQKKDHKQYPNTYPDSALLVFYHMHTDMWLNHTCLNIRIQNLLICN